MEHVLTRATDGTIKGRLSAYLRMLVAVTVVMIVIVLQFALSITRSYSDMLEMMDASQSLFEGVSTAQDHASHYLLYGDGEQRLEGMHAALSAAQQAAGRLGAEGIDGDFYRSMLDIECALDTAAQVLARLPQERRDAGMLLSFYENEYVMAREALAGVLAEQSRISKLLLGSAAQLRQELTRRVHQYGICMLVLLFGWAATALWYGRRIGWRVTAPIERLTREVMRLGVRRAQDLASIDVAADAYWEVACLTRAFNGMTQQVREQYRTLREKAELEKHLHEKETENLRIAEQLKTSQLRALQRQINPHFLFNTLNIIMDTAYMEEAPETAELLRCTAAFLRYALDCCEKDVTLGREMEMLGNYVFLQERRFGSRIRFEFDLESGLDQVHVPALILQPLVENAVAHGVGMYERQALVRIRTQRLEDGTVCVHVEDNGLGMDEPTLTRLQARLDSAFDADSHREGGIGLINVAQKLFVYYHGRAQVRVSSIPGNCTRVSLRIPPQA